MFPQRVKSNRLQDIESFFVRNTYLHLVSNLKIEITFKNNTNIAKKENIVK